MTACLSIGSRRELFVDGYLVQHLSGRTEPQLHHPIPGFARDDSHAHYGDQLDRIVSWTAGNDLSRVSGSPVRLRVADLYALRFGGDSKESI